MRRLRALSLVLLLLVLPGCSLVENLIVSPPPADYEAVNDGFRYNKLCLTPQEQYVYDQLIAGLAVHADSIEGLYPDSTMIETAVRAIERDYPEYFWFSGSGQIETTLIADRAVSATYHPTYTMDVSLSEEVQLYVDSWTASCVEGIPAGASDYDKALHVYTYLINNADYETREDNSIVNIMIHGGGLCGCYAKTAQYVLGQLGIPCAYISGQAGGESHAWNLMWLDGTPCWMDPTWGDPVYEGGDPADGPFYEYFGLTTEELTRTHQIDDRISVPDCTSQDYNYFRRSGLYLDWYQPEAIVTAMETALRSGWTRVPLQFAPDSYQEAVDVLFHQGQVHSLLRQADTAAGTGLDLTQSIWYSLNEDMYTVSIQIPY